MNKKLQVFPPVLRTYLGDAFCFSILGNTVYDNGWIFDKYIDIEYRKDHQMIKYAYYDYYDFLPYEGILIKRYHIIPMKEKINKEICNRVKQTINCDEYFFCFWNENIIRKYFGENTEEGMHFHGCFVFGYDDEKEIFYMLGYDQNKFSELKIPYSVFVEAAILGEHINNCFTYRSYKKNLQFELVPNYQQMIEGIIRFGKDKQLIENEISCYNLQGYERFVEHLKNLIPEKGKYHIPSIFCVYEHSVLMLKRLHFLNNTFEINSELILQYDKLVKKYEKIKNLAMKYNTIREEELANRIVDSFENAIMNERRIMSKIGDELTQLNS